MKNLPKKDISEWRQDTKKGYDDYDWDTLCLTSKVQPLHFQEIKKYLSSAKNAK